MNPRRWIFAPIATFFDGVRRFFAFYRWMTEWDAMVEPPPVRRTTALSPLIARLGVELAALTVLLVAAFGTLWLVDSGLEVRWWVGVLIGLALVSAGIGGQLGLPLGWRPSVTLFGAASAGAVILWSTALAMDDRGPVIDPSLPVERAILRYVLIATTLFLIRDLLFAYRPLMEWHGVDRLRYEALTGAAALSVAILFVGTVAADLHGLVLSGLTVAVLFLAALTVSYAPAGRLPRLALILLPATAVVTWVQLVWSRWVLRVDRGDADLTTELSTLIALVFLYELASYRYRRRREREPASGTGVEG